MPNVILDDYQIDAVQRMHNGCILCGAVGTGKSRTSLAYIYLKELQGTLKINGIGTWTKPTINRDIYIITTAKKRDSRDWDDELLPFGLSTDTKYSANHIKIVVDSWNNIQKYKKVVGAIFIFDEQRVVGTGKWAKTFMYIAKRNKWILLSGTPGDTFLDYVPVFIANGYFKNRSEFINKHVVYKPFMPYPVVDHLINKGTLCRYRKDILVYMRPPKENVKVSHVEWCIYDKEKYKKVWKERWNIYEDKPIEEPGTLCYVLRRIVNEDADRVQKLIKLIKEHPKSIIFYNYTPELNILRSVAKDLKYDIGEWNGEVHSDVPTTQRWVYLCQYNAAAEGWNCITTDTIIFYSQNYSYKMMVQAAGRIDRHNTPFKELHYYYLKSKAPIDIGIQRALDQKKRFNEQDFIRGTI